MGEKITLDRDSFAALASESRIKILRCLEKRQMTLSEIAREMEMSKPAVLKHLSKLTEAGLVRKEEGERKWVYYRLTSKGKNVLHPERVHIILLLSAFGASAAGAVASLWKYLGSKSSMASEKVHNVLNATVYNESGAATPVNYSRYLHVSMALAIFAAIMLSLAIIIYVRARRHQL